VFLKRDPPARGADGFVAEKEMETLACSRSSSAPTSTKKRSPASGPEADAAEQPAMLSTSATLSREGAGVEQPRVAAAEVDLRGLKIGRIWSTVCRTRLAHRSSPIFLRTSSARRSS
jgi:hypothetical protein